MNLIGKNITVLGFSRSGEAAAELLKKNGANVSISEKQKTPELEERAKKYIKRGFNVELGGHSIEKIVESDFIVKSPGIPMDSDIIIEANKRNIEIMGELELGSRFIKGKIIALTGSNGKSTTAALINHILQSAGKESVLCGNIGYPVSKAVLENREAQYYVIEVSSFQLESISLFKPFVAVLTNITPDHLDRHYSFDNYVAVKSRIFMNQNDSDYAVLNHGDSNCLKASLSVCSQKYCFGWNKQDNLSAYVQDDSIYLGEKGSFSLLVERNDSSLIGDHNMENIMAAAISSMLCGLSENEIRDAVKSFEGLEHRLELVTTISGISFYNDSKATNEDSSVKSLKAFPDEQNIVLILGGRDKGSDYKSLIVEIKKKVKRLVLIGENRHKLENRFDGITEIMKCDSMDEAVVRGVAGLNKGDIFLLAPACASFDMFTSFEDRGRAFKRAVIQLKESVNG